MVAFDNFDLFVNTPSGKDTLHETVEIGIQTIPSQEDESDQPLIDEEFEEPNTSSQRKRRRRTFAAINDELCTLSQEAVNVYHFAGCERREEKSECGNH